MAEGKFAGVTQAMLDYYIGLALNNNREYYLATKDVYEREVRAPLLDLAETLAPAALQLDEEMEQRPGHILARIRRDTRFTRDKSPYRDHAWLSFRPMGRRKSGSFGLYAALGPQGCCYGAGFYDEEPARARRIREAILRNPDEFEAAGLDEWFGGAGVCLVEWPETVDLDARPCLRLTLRRVAEDGARDVELVTDGVPLNEAAFAPWRAEEA